MRIGVGTFGEMRVPSLVLRTRKDLERTLADIDACSTGEEEVTGGLQFLLQFFQ